MPCTLSIIGTNLDIDDFVKKSRLEHVTKRYKGDVIGAKTSENFRKLKYSYISITISDADFDLFAEQIKDTIDYLEKNNDKLKYIALTEHIEYATINFGVSSNNKSVQSFFLPNKLVSICGNLNIGIEFSIYADVFE